MNNTYLPGRQRLDTEYRRLHLVHNLEDTVQVITHRLTPLAPAKLSKELALGLSERSSEKDRSAAGVRPGRLAPLIKAWSRPGRLGRSTLIVRVGFPMSRMMGWDGVSLKVERFVCASKPRAAASSIVVTAPCRHARPAAAGGSAGCYL